MGALQVAAVLFRWMFQGRAKLIAENLALRPQLGVLRCSVKHSRHHCPTVVYFNLTGHPTARWTAQQIGEALPYDNTPSCLVRDRDAIYCPRFVDHYNHRPYHAAVGNVQPALLDQDQPLRFPDRPWFSLAESVDP